MGSGGNCEYRDVVRDSMNKVAAPFAPMFMGDNPSRLENEIGEEVG